ncbi:MAG: DUF1028 domain-containing protein [Candidatus Bathyarchaeota archaeon]|nr:DUF1028 domain-containing protein [Candidatus Bathyarchaeota archaeon]
MYPKLNRWVATFSIVAFDPSTKDLGVAVHSRYFSVGSVVPWAEAGVGAIATQSFVNVSYGPRGLQLLMKGLTVNEVMERLTGQDEAKDYRQLGIVGSKGNVAVFTGKKCLKWAGSKTGKNHVALGNILAGEEVVSNMSRRFESAKDDLAGKLVVALEGGEEAGGDIRGRQSASLLVVRKGGGRGGYGDRYIDLRVEDHPNPIGELKRLLDLSRVYYLIDESEDKFTAGNLESALSTIRKAVSLNPNIDDAYVNLAMIFLKLERKEDAVRAFKEALRINPKLKQLIKQLPDIGLMERDKELFAKLQIT